MHSLLSYRFLRWFAGDLKNRRKQPASVFNDQIFETDVDMTSEPGNSTSKEDCADKLSGVYDLQIYEEQNKKNET
ncbi:MAG TPA: hypothetical protein VN452_00460 [Longilinea sp.]|nr:hypothetical protein [Longilinea sp.]